MRKIKFLTLLATMPLLTGCFLGGGGRTVELDEFVDELFTSVKANEFVTKDGIKDSKEATFTFDVGLTNNLTSGSKKNDLGSTQMKVEGKAQADVTNEILYVEYALTTSTAQQEVTQRQKLQIQKGQDGKFLAINILNRTYAVSEITDFKTFTNYVASRLESFDFDAAAKQIKENEQIKQYKDLFTFTINGSAFTVEVNGEKEIEKVGSLVSNGTKVTVDLTNGNESLEGVMDLSLKTTLEEDGIYTPIFGGGSVQVKKGDIVEMTIQGNALAKVYNADLSLSKIDVSDFVH